MKQPMTSPRQFLRRLRRFRPGLIAVLALAAVSAADDAAIVSGRVRSEYGAPGRGLSVTFVDPERPFRAVAVADEEGRFLIGGLPPGSYEIRVEGESPASLAARTEVELPTAQHYRLNLIVSGPASAGRLSVEILVPDHPLSPQRTYIGRGQLDRLPSGNDVWTVIENQDFSATMNRIDVGGLWATRPGLFSARGGGSWTQTVYALDGVDVTDPYQPGLPLVHPDLFALESLELVNSGPPVHVSSPGGLLNLDVREGGSALQGALSLFGFNAALRSDNITPALRQEGLESSHSLRSGFEGNLRFGGPVVKDRLFLFTSWTAFDLERDIAEFEGVDRSFLSSGLVHLTYVAPAGRLRLLWTGQSVS
ncbi:MAG: carboxypeptidase regulatory-like domain-containing protein, partial [Candidatus Aminicenantes bacterium]|nr:carboxypeptidase regulatory-like domain-containing protein [Candidatus Aminicenantes bacterium]